MVRHLISRDADINASDNAGWAPLHFAASTANVEVAEVLLEAGADVNAQTRSYGQIPLHITPLEDFPSSDPSAIVQLSNILGRSTPEIAQQMARIERAMLGPLISKASLDRHKDFVILLLQRGSKRDQKDKNGLTPLALARKSGRTNAVRAFTDAGLSE